MKIVPTCARRGFTLIEVVLALAISGTMLTTIFFMADSTIKTTNGLVEVQSEEVTRDAFFKLLERHFKELPGNCRMELTFSESGRRYLSDMTFQNAPTSFNWGGAAFSTEAMRITTQPEAEGGVSIVLSYFDQPILDSDETVAERGIDPIAEIFLLSNVHLFEWRVLDGRSMEWAWDWNLRGRRPTQVELVVQFGDSNQRYRRIFWIPTKQSPANHMNQIRSSARNNRGGDPSATGNRTSTGGTRNTGQGGTAINPEDAR